MTVIVEVEDPAWLSLAGLEELAVEAATAALRAGRREMPGDEIAVLFTDDVSIAQINSEWRGKNSPTNVLSFPSAQRMPIPKGEARPLGDIVLAHGVISGEAAEQGKTLRDHTAHLIVHGTLHLLGYDHESDREAEIMEHLEADILKGLGIPDPYERQ